MADHNAHASPLVQQYEVDTWVEAPDGVGFIRVRRQPKIDLIELPKLLLCAERDRQEEEDIKASARAQFGSARSSDML